MRATRWRTATASSLPASRLPTPPAHACSEAEYTEYRALRLFVGTWNVNGKMPRESLAPWLLDGASEGGAGGAPVDLPDIYVVGCVAVCLLR